MKLRFYIACMIIMLLLIAGCGRQPTGTAGLTAASGEAGTRWGIPGNLIISGAGNIHRIVAGPGIGAAEALEMAAGGQGVITYYQDITAGTEASAAYRLQFLSTQGTGRIAVTALDDSGHTLGSAGWVFTGSMPQQTATEKWLDVRYRANYVGDWVSHRVNLYDFLSSNLSQELAAKASRYRFTVETGQGQHALVSQFTLFSDLARVLRLTPATTRISASQGEGIHIEAVVENTSRHVLPNFKISLIEPYGFGLVASGEVNQQIASLKPGEKRIVSWDVRAQRPDAVNMHKPWQLRFRVDGRELPAEVSVSVRDTRPGQIMYVMTEDLEPIDAAGYPAAWGNTDGWIGPEELIVQMAHKAEALNAIAERYGARWTHYTAFPVLKAAEWAARQSASGKWTEAVNTVTNSIRQQAQRGHEYSLHLHMDYDPELPGNVLSYNEAVDGLWANHLRHGWAHSIAAEGDFNDPFSRTGSLVRYQSIADELSSGSPLGQLITARVGSFDFGHGSESEALSTRAYRKIGLWGSSDADGNEGGITSADYGREIYFARPDDINKPADNIQQIGLVEFRPTPKNFIMYDSQDTAGLNKRVDEGIAFFTDGAAVKPGIHAIVGFTHAMFIMGQGDWRSVTGGQFNAIDGHLQYLKNRYADTGILKFSTANDLVKAYLDYYTPTLVALYGPQRSHNLFYSEYTVELLGRDIPADASRPHQVSVKYPLYLRDEAYRVAVLKNGNEVFSTTGLPTPNNDIVFTVDDKTASYSIKIYHNRAALRMIETWRAVKRKIF